MNFNLNESNNNVSKPEMEQVENEKEEYKLIGHFIRTPGLKLFSYNHIKDELFEVEVSNKKVIDFLDFDKTHPEEATVDSRNEHFEALNMRTAKRRIRKYKAGKIKVLCNLKEPSKEGIKIF